MEYGVRQKLRVLRVLRQAFDYLGDHGGRLISDAPQLILLLAGGEFLAMHLRAMAGLEQSSLLELAGWLVGMTTPVFLAVAWHRRILLDEAPRRGLAAGKPERMYFVLLAAGSVVLAVTTLLSVVIIRLALPFPGLYWLGYGLAALVGVILPCYFLCHFSLALPQAALTGKVDLREIAALARGNKLRLIVLAILPVPLFFMLEVVGFFLPQLPRAPGLAHYLCSTLVLFISLLVSVALMSVTYRTLAFPPAPAEGGPQPLEAGD
ncbi:hypothetical protein ACOTDF_00085 [Achromobacter insuavis]|uniref:hypothetical protein n=1 Tax=Achromobacter insuavis TaxID=1287735 RepID=UPI003B9DB284